jgi:hypothetical protein
MARLTATAFVCAGAVCSVVTDEMSIIVPSSVHASRAASSQCLAAPDKRKCCEIRRKRPDHPDGFRHIGLGHSGLFGTSFSHIVLGA